MIIIGSRYLLSLLLPAEKSNWNRLLLISGERCSSFQASAMSLKYDVPDCYGGDHGGWKQVLTGQNVYGKDILQKKWLEKLFSGRNGDSKILPRLYGVATACCVSWQISNLKIWKTQQGNLLRENQTFYTECFSIWLLRKSSWVQFIWKLPQNECCPILLKPGG